MPISATDGFTSNGRRRSRVPRIGPFPDALSDTWRYALAGGLVALPATAIGYWLSGSELSLSPVLLGGVLAGYLARRGPGGAGVAAGVRAGLVGAFPALWLVVDS